MTTTFQRWLDENGLSAWRYAEERGLYKESVRGLAGLGGARIPSFYTTRILELVSAETGIPIETLILEAAKGSGQSGRRPAERREREDIQQEERT